MSAHLAWGVREDGMGPGPQGCWREKSFWGQCGKDFACHPEGSGFCPLDSQEPKKVFLLGVTRSQLCLGSASLLSLETLPLLQSIAQMCGVPPLRSIAQMGKSPTQGIAKAGGGTSHLSLPDAGLAAQC